MHPDVDNQEARLRAAEWMAVAARLGVVALFAWGAWASQRALAAVERAQEVTTAVERVKLHQTDMRMHMRGFLLSLDPSEARELGTARDQRDLAFRSLQTLTAGVPSARRQVAAIRFSLDSGDAIGARVRWTATGDADRNQDALRSSGLLPVSDTAEAQLDALLRSEQATLFAVTARQHRAIKGTLAAAGIGAVLAAFFGLTTLRLRRLNAEVVAGRAASFRRLADDNPDGVLVHVAGQVVYANAAIVAMLRAEARPLLGRRVMPLVHPDDRAEIDRRTDHVSQEGTATPPRLIRFLRDDGSVCEAEARGAPILFGDMPAIQVVLRDLTARREAEHALAESEARFRAVLDTMGEGVVLHDADLTITLSNPAAHRILGLPAGQLTGWTANDRTMRTVDRAGAPLPRDQYAGAMALRTGLPAAGVMGVVRSSRDIVWISVNAVPLFHDGTTSPIGVVVTFADFTARRALEDQLQQAQKMEVMGRMASGVAHDFNNLLTIIRSASELLRLETRRVGVAFDTLEDIESATDRAAALTTHLLTFSRRQHAAPVLLDPAQVVGDALPILRRLAGESVSVVHESSAAGMGWISADPVRFEQVLVNLVSNAKDAMPTGGIVKVHTGLAVIEDSVTHRFGVIEAGRYATLTVEDTGEGMTGDVMAHLFDPFYTTKPQGRGTGLGLSIVYGVVHEALGTITVHSEPGQGSRLTVYWPCADSWTETAGSIQPSEEPRTASAPPPLFVASDVPTRSADGGLILLVDDEETVRRVVAKQLEAHGYVVITADSGRSALAMLRNEAFDIRAVVSDVRMPGMTGVEFVLAMHAEQIDRPVLLVSGQMDAHLPREWPDGAVVRFLSKPLSGMALRRMVSELVAISPRTDAPRADLTH